MLGQYENDLRNPKYEMLQKIADAIGVQVSDLIEPDNADREYETICDTLEVAKFNIEATGFNYGGGPGGDTFSISHIYDDDEDDEEPEESSIVSWLIL